MRAIMRLIYCILSVLILCGWTAFSIPDDKDPVKSKKGKKQDRAIVTVIDSDNDNIPDNEDECPNIPGPKSTKGCPDSDGDGIPDHLDDCPVTAGLEQFKGCPDTDHDGIPDNKDVCPYDAGPASNNGCPLPTEKEETGAASKTTKIIDTINLDEDRDSQIMRYERYIAEQQHKQQEYMAQLVSRMTQNNPDASANSVVNNNNNSVEDNNAKKEPAVTPPVTPPANPVTPPANPETSLSSVKIDNVMYQGYKPKIEALLKNMRFQDGRVSFADENKFFDALVELASYCKAYPEWTVVFHCYSNETDNAFGNKQLFSNRVYTLKQILVNDLNIPANKLNFTNDISRSSEISNFISLEIIVK
jgi:outer membrane protein OmpA-like peptidoglycan-associated protein